MYTAHDIATCVAEVFQSSRTVRASADTQLAAWRPARPLRLLDLTGEWALHNGASHGLYAASKSTCRNWSRAIHQRWSDIDGLLSPSTMTGKTMVTLYERAADAFPPRPAFARPLTNPYVWEAVVDAAEQVRYTVH